MTIAQLYGRIRHFHRDERVIALASRPLGQAAVLAATCALLLPRDHPLWRLACVSLLLIQLAPAARNEILTLAGVFVLYVWAASRLELSWEGLQGQQVVEVLGVMLFAGAVSYACYRIARSLRRLPRLVRRRPQVFLHVVVWASLLGVTLLPDPTTPTLGVFAVASASLGGFAWRLGYVLIAGKRGSAARSRLPDHFFYIWPVFGGTSVPYGKGYDYLSRHAADSPEARAHSRLAGLKLLCLAWLWQGVSIAVGGAVHADEGNPLSLWLGSHALGIPRLHELIQNDPVVTTSVVLCWVSLFLELITRTLELAVEGHVIVGVLRLLGFNVFRNTYKPLLSETIVDFWNRFHHYFKELLVEFFFLPTYVSYFKRSPRLRLFAATFMAACLGNLYFHILSNSRALLALQAGEAWALTLPRAFYSVLLALGIFVSMLREQRRRGTEAPSAAARPWRRLRRIAGVWLFFGIIHIWSLTPSEMSFARRNAFFLSLFGG